MERERERQTDKEHKAWRLIRTVAGIVAKLISQRKLGSSPYLLAPAKPISQGPPQGEQPGTACLTLTAMIAEWVQVKFGDKWSAPPHSARKLVFLCYTHLHSSSKAKLLQVSLEQNHMNIQHVASVSLRRVKNLQCCFHAQIRMNIIIADTLCTEKEGTSGITTYSYWLANTPNTSFLNEGNHCVHLHLLNQLGGPFTFQPSS